MLVQRPPNNKQVPINIIGSSVFGIYRKMDSQITYNMTISDGWFVPYPGYKIGVPSSAIFNATNGRGLYESVKLNAIYSVFDNGFYQIIPNYSHAQQKVLSYQVALLGRLQTSSGKVYISENNKPQILISDGSIMYVYDPELSTGSFNFSTTNTSPDLVYAGNASFEQGEPIVFTGTPSTPLIAGKTYYIAVSSYDSTTNETTISIVEDVQDVLDSTQYIVMTSNDGATLFVASNFFSIATTFTPGYITFHDTYFITAASNDNYYAPPANNTWRLSANNNGFLWLDIAQRIGLLETKPDNTKAVVRFPSKGNLILVMGETVTEFWYDTGAQLFPYQRNNQTSIDYGCVSPATVSYMDEIVIWLAKNEKSGPIIMYTNGGEAQKVTTDGIDFMLSEIERPESSEGFLFRKNGHLFYHINFYFDNFSFVVDLTAMKIYNASDHNMNYYSMGNVVWYNNQYYAISKDNGNLFIFDTIFNTYDYVLPNNTVETVMAPRIRVCDNIRLPSQEYFIVNDIGFTIETGETDYFYQNLGDTYLTSEAGNPMLTEDGNFLVGGENPALVPTVPAVDLSLSYDGGASYSQPWRYELNPIGKRKNRLQWWQCGAGNDCVPQFRFWNIGTVTCTQDFVNILI